MTMEERVIKGLTCCVTKEHCHYGEDGCPWHFPENPEDCTSRLARAANGLIQFYKREIAEKTQENTFLKRMQQQTAQHMDNVTLGRMVERALKGDLG